METGSVKSEYLGSKYQWIIKNPIFRASENLKIVLQVCSHWCGFERESRKDEGTSFLHRYWQQSTLLIFKKFCIIPVYIYYIYIFIYLLYSWLELPLDFATCKDTAWSLKICIDFQQFVPLWFGFFLKIKNSGGVFFLPCNEFVRPGRGGRSPGSCWLPLWEGWLQSGCCCSCWRQCGAVPLQQGLCDSTRRHVAAPFLISQPEYSHHGASSSIFYNSRRILMSARKMGKALNGMQLAPLFLLLFKLSSYSL